jgi:hypothetical protein
MSRSALVMVGMVIGSLIGGYLPVLFGSSILSVTSVIGNAIGGLVGIFVSYKLSDGF